MKPIVMVGHTYMKEDRSLVHIGWSNGNLVPLFATDAWAADRYFRNGEHENGNSPPLMLDVTGMVTQPAPQPTMAPVQAPGKVLISTVIDLAAMTATTTVTKL